MSNKFAFHLVSLSFLFIFLISAKSSDVFVEDYISIEELMKSKHIDVTISGIGGYKGDCVQFTIKNKTSKPILILIERGRRLLSIDTTIQDIFIVKQQEFILASNQSIVRNGYGFCCQSSNGSPRKKSKFKIGYLAPNSWRKLAEVIDENDFPKRAIQSAIWALSDNHEVSSIYDKNNQAIRILKQTVCNIKGVEMPWYSTRYVENDSLLFSHIPRNISGVINYKISNNESLTVVVRKNGLHVMTLVEGSKIGSGKHSYVIDLHVKGWPKGDYDISLYVDSSRLIERKGFKL